MNDKVYLVTTYDDNYYDVHGVFTTKELAEEYRIAISADEVEERPLNPKDHLIHFPAGSQCYYLTLNKKGELSRSRTLDIRGVDKSTPIQVTHTTEDDQYEFGVVAKSLQSALDLAQAKRVEMLKNNEWISSYYEYHQKTFPWCYKKPTKEEMEQTFNNMFAELFDSFNQVFGEDPTKKKK